MNTVLLEKLEVELTKRGVLFRKPDVFGFVAAGYDEATGQKSVGEWADAFEEGLEGNKPARS